MNPIKNKYHTLLAEYFTSQPLYLDEKNNEKPNVRKLVEQTRQQTKAEMWDEVIESLCDLWSLNIKVKFGMVYGLVEGCADLHQSKFRELPQTKDPVFSR